MIPECDPAFATEVRDQKLYEQEIPSDLPITIPVLGSILDYFLPLAYAWSDARHHTYAYAEPWSCDYGTCKISYGQISTGTHNISAGTGGGEHGTSQEVDIYVGSCGNGSGAGSYNVVAADFNIGFNTKWSALDTGYGCASDATNGLVVDNHQQPVWGWVLSGTSDAYQQ